MSNSVQKWLWRTPDADWAKLSRGSKKPCSQQIELGAPIHLTLDQLQLGVLALGLAIRPWQLQRGLNRCLISHNTAGKGCHHAGRGIGNPWFKIGALSFLDELMETSGEISGARRPRAAFAIMAIICAPSLDGRLRSVVINRAMLRAEGVVRGRDAPNGASSSRRRRVAHSAITRELPRNPAVFKRRQSSAPLRQPFIHSASSCSRKGPSEFVRLRNMSVRPPRTICRMMSRDRLIRRAISLIDTPAFASVRMAAFPPHAEPSHHIGAAQPK